MANTVLLSAMTMIALTGITLTTLKYRHDDSYVELDDDDNSTDVRHNPKFHFYDVLGKNHSAVKRSSGDNAQYSIFDTNVSMIDDAKREKVKQVQTGSRSDDCFDSMKNVKSQIVITTNKFFFLSFNWGR
jgi:hypothetical protein